MYKDKEQQLREKELQRTVKQYLQGRREHKDPEGDYEFIEACPYDELPCSEEEKATLRAIAEERLPELEAEIPRLIRYNAYVRTRRWPVNLYDAIYTPSYSGEETALNERAEGVLLEALHTLDPIEERCVLMFYKEHLPWDEICDELDIYATELDERIARALRKLRHPDIAGKIQYKGIGVGEKQALTDEEIAIKRLNNVVEITHKRHWPLNLHAMVIGGIGLPFGQEVALNEKAESVMVQALRVLTPLSERCILELFRQQKPWQEICKEFDISAAKLYDIYFKSIRRLRKRDVRGYITQQQILA